MRYKAAFVAILFIITSGPSVSASKPQIIIRDLPEYGLRLRPSTDTKFQDSLNAVLRGAIDPAAEVGKPFGVLLENESDVDLMAYSFRWVGTDSEGETFRLLNASFHSQKIEDQHFWIHPGSNAIITPSFFVFNLQIERPLNIPYPILWHSLDKMETIEICLDAALFKDGRFVGPNETRAYERVMALPQGRKDAMEELLARHEKGESDKTLLDWIQNLANEPLHVGGIAYPDQPSKQVVANFFLAIYKNAGSERAFAFAAKEAARPLPNIIRVPYSVR